VHLTAPILVGHHLDTGRADNEMVKYQGGSRHRAVVEHHVTGPFQLPEYAGGAPLRAGPLAVREDLGIGWEIRDGRRGSACLPDEDRGFAMVLCTVCQVAAGWDLRPVAQVRRQLVVRRAVSEDEKRRGSLPQCLHVGRVPVGFLMTDTSGRQARSRVLRLEQAVGHLSAADSEAEAADFDRGLRAIVGYAAEQGRCDVPPGYVDESGFRLAVWVAAQREEHLEQRLKDDRRAALERVPGWEWEPAGRNHGVAGVWQA